MEGFKIRGSDAIFLGWRWLETGPKGREHLLKTTHSYWPIPGTIDRAKKKKTFDYDDAHWPRGRSKNENESRSLDRHVSYTRPCRKDTVVPVPI